MSFAARFEDEADAERRDAPRRTLRLGVPGHFGDGGGSAVTVHNISATGLLIETASLLDEGELFAVDLPEAGEQSAEVVWASAPMYGCRLAGRLHTAALSAIRTPEVIEASVGRRPPYAGRPDRVAFTPSLTHSGHWKPTAAGRMQSGQMNRSQRWQRIQVSRSGCR